MLRNLIQSNNNNIRNTSSVTNIIFNYSKESEVENITNKHTVSYGTKKALILGTHSLKITDITCCGFGCYDCAYTLYAKSLCKHLEKSMNPEQFLEDKLQGANGSLRSFIEHEIQFYNKSRK